MPVRIVQPIDTATYRELRERLDRHRGEGGPSPTNEERSAIEVYEFVHDPPVKYFLYIDEPSRSATTWMGDVLGRVSFGQSYRSAFGDTRVPIWVDAINGLLYHGTYFKSAGDYARIKLAKQQPKVRR